MKIHVLEVSSVCLSVTVYLCVCVCSMDPLLSCIILVLLSGSEVTWLHWHTLVCLATS